MIALCLLALTFGCGVREAPVRVVTEPLSETWAAVSHHPSELPAYLGNRQFGIRLSASGNGMDGEGGDLPCFLYFHDALVRLPNPASWSISVDGTELSHSKGDSYVSRLDFRTGVWRVSWVQKVGGKAIRFELETVANPVSAVVAQRLRVVGIRGMKIVFWNGFGPPNSVGVDPVGSYFDWTSGRGSWAVSEFESSLSTMSAHCRVKLAKWEGLIGNWMVSEGGYEFTGQSERDEITVERIAGVATGGESVADFGNYESCRLAAEEWWLNQWKTDIEIDGPVSDQQAVRSFLFYLYMSGTPKLPPMGLSSERYKGHRFWDAEVWLLPVYVLIDRELASVSTAWRLEKWSQKHRIPWECTADGLEGAPAVFEEAIHVWGWVAWWMQRAYSLGIVSEQEVRKVRNSVAALYRDRSVKTERGLELLNVMSPDEGSTKDNDLVTNLLANWCTGSEDFYLPRAPDGVFSNHEGDQRVGYQQASAVLGIYPLEMIDDGQESGKVFDAYKDKVSRYGPAMSDSIHSIIACRLGRVEEAYRYWRRSWEPYVDRSLMLFRERLGGATYFMTGAGGCLQAVIYGFLGIRFEKFAGDREKLSKSLGNDWWLVVSPNLPQEWSRVVFRGIDFPTGRYTIIATHEGISIEEGGE